MTKLACISFNAAMLFGCAANQAAVASPEPRHPNLKAGAYSLKIDSVNGNQSYLHEFTLNIGLRGGREWLGPHHW